MTNWRHLLIPYFSYLFNDLMDLKVSAIAYLFIRFSGPSEPSGPSQHISVQKARGRKSQESQKSPLKGARLQELDGEQVR